MNEDLEKLIQGVPGVVYRFRISADGERRFLFLSEGVRDLYGCSPQEGCEKIGPMLDCVLEEDRARLHDTVEQSRNQLTPWFHEFRIRSRSVARSWARRSRSFASSTAICTYSSASGADNCGRPI